MIEYISEIIGMLGVVVGMIGVIFYLRGRQTKKISYATKKIEILTKKSEIPNLSIFFGNEPIETLFLTKVAVYNEGNQVIISSDVTKRDPLPLSRLYSL